MSIFVIFQQGHDPDIKTDPPACLFSSPYKTSRSSILCANLDHSLHAAAEELFERIEEYEGFGSGWVIEKSFHILYETPNPNCIPLVIHPMIY